MYKLVIAEKPSVAQSIAKVIGATERNEGYVEGNGYIVSWCVGHLVELAEPEAYDEKYAKWNYSDLPIIPMDWKYQVSESTKKQFRVLQALMKREDVDSVINSCDAGREGELIFRLVYHQAGCRKPIERLWISSMEDKAILDGFAELKKGSEYDALYEAALCRERADWIVGMNATRLFSTLYGQTLNVGRVMTPTLAMLVQREAEINGFKSEPFYTISITAGGVTAIGERIMDKAEAEQILSKVQAASEAVVRKNQTTEKLEKAPRLYDLTSLQRDANKMLGFTAQQTLDYAQSLYEKKLLTYPRTDSRFLTEDMETSIEQNAGKIAEKFGCHGSLVLNTKQVINNKKVNDHHAIIPTANVYDVNYGELPSGEQKILALVSCRFLVGMGEACVIRETELEFGCADGNYKAKAKQVVQKGWREIQEWFFSSKKEESDDSEDGRILENLNYFEEGKKIPARDAAIKEGKTTPKKHFTEDTLLSAMENASADEMPEEAERKGIGTPATRAGTIEKLVRIGFVERKGDKKTKYLIPTHKGTALITVMPEEIQSASMTADWEEKLIDIEQGHFSSDTFIQEIGTMIMDLVQTYHVIEDAEVLMHPANEPVGNCPCCGKVVVEKTKGFFCESKECDFALWKNNRFFDSLSKKLTKQVAEKLIKDGKAKLKGCRSVKTGKTYDCTVTMTVSEDAKPQFGLEFEKRRGVER